MKRPSVVYDVDFYSSKSLLEWAELFEAKLPPNVNHLLSAGCSGAVIAAAIMAIRGQGNKEGHGHVLKHCHIHPEKRTSHRGTQKWFSGEKPDDKSVCAFVDDFCSTGKTCETSLDQLFKRYKMMGYGKPKIGCILLSGKKNEDGTCKSLAGLFKTQVIFANGQRRYKYQKPKEAKETLTIPCETSMVEPMKVEA